MRKLIPAVMAAFLAACGGGSDGGGGGAAATALTVTSPRLGGTTTATNAAGFASPPATLSCTFPAPIGAVTASYAVVVASTAPAICSAPSGVVETANSTAVVVAIGRGRQGTGAPPAIEPGTYTVSRSLQSIGGDILIVAAEVIRFGAASQCLETELDVTSGTVVVDSNVNGTIRGNVNLAIDASDGGGTVTGTFVANACATPVSTTVCSQLVAGSVSWSDLFANSTCVP